MTAAPDSSQAAKSDGRPRVRLGVALTGLLLIAVLATAAVVHVSWTWTADRNIETIVGTLSAEASSAVQHELGREFQGAEGAAEIIRSILFQGALSPEDEARREFVFLSVIRSLPWVSWIGFGFPDGRFFGSHKTGDDKLEMVEIGGPLSDGRRPKRRDLYDLIPGDIFFRERVKEHTGYVPQGSAWYRTAAAAKGPHWSVVDILPSGFEPAAVVSTELEIYGQQRGVLMVAIGLERLSRFMRTLDIARTGAVLAVDQHQRVIATSLDTKPGEMPRMAQLAAADQRTAPLIEAMQRALAQPVLAQRPIEVAGAGDIFVSMTPLRFEGWYLMTALPRSAFTADIDQNTRRLVVALIVLVVIDALVAALFANFFFARPIQRIVAELKHVEEFAPERVRRVPTSLKELDDLSGALKRMAGGLSAFGRYIPMEIVNSLVSKGIDPKPGGELREITVLFADLPGFTTLTERYGAQVEPFLTQFLTTATAAVHAEGGTVDKFIGDAIMAFWNAPEPEPEHALRACRAANAIRAAMHALPRPDDREEGPRVRAGINTGVALVGNVGSSERLSYTAIGDVVNVASRLEALTKEFGVEIIVGAATKREVGDALPMRPLGTSGIRGRDGMVDVFELLPEGVADRADEHSPPVGAAAQ